MLKITLEDMKRNAKIKFNNSEKPFNKMIFNGREDSKSKYKPNKNKFKISRDSKEINCKKSKTKERNKHCSKINN